MTAKQCINRAAHCINTGQSNLASLYIARARQLVRHERLAVAGVFYRINRPTHTA